MLPTDALATLEGALAAAAVACYPQAPAPDVTFEAPRRPEFGDFSTNVAFSLTKIARRSPQDVARALIDAALAHDAGLRVLFSSIEPMAGFINVRLAPASWHAVLARILREGADFGRGEKTGTRISLEFGSANPTGPLVVVQGRTLSTGDTLAKTLRFRGRDVFVEWIINDAGSQVDTLGRSIYARYRQILDPSYPFPEEGYPGDYLRPIARAIYDRDGEDWVDRDESAWLRHFSKFGRDELVAQQQRTALRFGVHYDLWQSEKEMHDQGRVTAGLQRLIDLGATYEQDGAVFFRATAFGDDKDRAIVRSDGRPTYYAADIAYHYEKLQRADRVIDILGPDHHGYIGRLKGLAAALGYEGKLEVTIAQQITLMRGGEQVSMSKRAGDIITLDDILDEVGVDAARFFFIMLSLDSPLTFDLKLAVEQSAENPVFYVQYGHARIASVLRNADPGDCSEAARTTALDRLDHPAELALARRLAELPGVAEGVAVHLAPHRLARYARDVASDFHQFYTECKVLGDDRELRIARLALCIATKTVLATVLELCGVTAPESM